MSHPFNVNARPTRRAILWLSLVPFVVLVGGYFLTASMRQKEALKNGDEEKITPSATQLWSGVKSTCKVSPKTGNMPQVLYDTLATLKRFAIGLAISSVAAILIGLHMGTFPWIDAFLRRFFVALNNVQPMAIVPLLFVLFGFRETFKIVLVAAALLPGLTLEVYNRAKEIPRETIIAAQTFAASPMELAYRVILPIVLPFMLESIRIQFKAAMGAVLVGEYTGSSEGLGHRLQLYGRYNNMSTIIPYVLWITAVMFLADLLVGLYMRRYRWVKKNQ